jgi:PleD family two-component response regulator
MAVTQKRVLVVDDALDIARLLRSALGAADPDLVINVFLRQRKRFLLRRANLSIS